jgi:hypothetical protein
VHNNQRDGHMRQQINVGRVSYQPNSIGGGCPMQAPAREGGFVTFPQALDGAKVRERGEKFFDHFSQATMFYNSQSEPEKAHLVDALRFVSEAGGTGIGIPVPCRVTRRGPGTHPGRAPPWRPIPNALKKGLAPSHPSFCEYTSTHLVEREADHFASNLLMPPTRFMNRAKRSLRGMGGILDLAYTFGTSVTSTAIRYVKDEVQPCVVVKWQDGRVAWTWSSVKMQKARFRRPNMLQEKLPQESPTARALAGEAPVGDYFSDITKARLWFPRVGVNEGGDLPLVEQAIQLGRFGVLTVLYPESRNFGQTH